MARSATPSFELATWYDTWNATGLSNLQNQIVPLYYATRYNLAFGQLSSVSSGGYSVEMGPYADDVKAQIASQAPGAAIYAGLGSTGIVDTVADNEQYQNRSTENIVSWLQANGYSGISIDAEDRSVMLVVPAFIQQIGPNFQAAGLGIAVSAPWPGEGPESLYGSTAVDLFTQYVNVVELQDYSYFGGTPNNAPVWVQAGISASMLMGGVCTENGDAQTSLEDTADWTQYALQNGLAGMFSWRLDNDHGTQGEQEDVDPTFTGAQTIYETVMGSDAEATPKQAVTVA